MVAIKRGFRRGQTKNSEKAVSGKDNGGTHFPTLTLAVELLYGFPNTQTAAPERHKATQLRRTTVE